MVRCLWLFVFLLALPSSLQAEEASTNLLTNARIISHSRTGENIAVLTDGLVTPEGAEWKNEHSLVFDDTFGQVTFDLGSPFPVALLVIQADANDTYRLELSADGDLYTTTHARSLVGVDGLRTREIATLGSPARFIRISPEGGDGLYSISEIQGSTDRNTVPGRKIVEISGTGSSTSGRDPSLTLEQSNIIKLLLALVGAFFLFWTQTASPELLRRFRFQARIFMILLSIVSYSGYYNWGYCHFPNTLHYHEFYHYYMGAKYFPENGYSRLYSATVIAEAELGADVSNRRIRNLSTNELIYASDTIRDSGTILVGFSPSRWRAFKQDVSYFRTRTGGGSWWEAMLQDHGYNPTPVWNLVGSAIANMGSASDTLFFLIAWLDPILLLTTFYFVYRSFGLKTCCLLAIFFGTYFPSLYYWTGGAFLRQDWLAASVLGICALKRNRFGLAGASLSYAALVRVFPAVFLLPIAARLVVEVLNTRSVPRWGRRFLGWYALTAAIFIAFSSVAYTSRNPWPEFVSNIEKHSRTPLTNHMGLKTLVAYRTAFSQEKMYQPSAADPFSVYKERRIEMAKKTRWLYLSLLAAVVIGVVFASIRKAEIWEVAILGIALIPASTELTCYYYSFLGIAALLVASRPPIGVTLLSLAAISQAIPIFKTVLDQIYVAEGIFPLSVEHR